MPGNGYKMQKCTYSDEGHILTKTVYKTGSEDMDRQYVYNEKGLVVKETLDMNFDNPGDYNAQRIYYVLVRKQ